MRLTLGDYDPVEHVLLVRDSKFYKSRMVPLSNDAAVRSNTTSRTVVEVASPAARMHRCLLHRRGSGLAAYSGNGLRVLMRHLFQIAGVRTASGHLPRVHDLRFTFAFHALLRWYRTGADLHARLPALATYMGHVSILSTQYYLPILDVGRRTRARSSSDTAHASSSPRWTKRGGQ